jgi:putative ABC transport system permease protein
MMNHYKRAYRYVTRKKKKSILLSIIIMIALLIGLLGTTLLHSFDSILVQIGRQSQAKVIISAMEMERLISAESIDDLRSIQNIDVVNRVNEVIVSPIQLEISVGNNETKENARLRLQGFDDLNRSSLFAQEVVRLEEGTLDIEDGEVIIHALLALSNGLAVGNEMIFYNDEQNEVHATIAGLYNYVDPNIENEPHFLSMFRFENLVFAHPDFIHDLQQGNGGYVEAHFYVNDPRLIQDTQQAFARHIDRSIFEIRISDVLFQRMSAPLLQTENMVTMILLITGGATVFVISLLLALWSQERRSEVALLLSMGESKMTILIQRNLEVLSIYIGTFPLVLIVNVFVAPYFDRILQIDPLVSLEMMEISTKLSVQNVQLIFIVGIMTLVISTGVSCVSVMRLMPKKIFSSMD